MRITNKIMQRNNLSNINTNKIYQDKLSTQMSTQKKINRPSDDPVVAIRALRLRGNVTEVTQYYTKNIPDAESWLSVTEGALKNLSDIVTKMIEQCTKGANGDLTTKDRQIVLEQLKALGDEVYATGDADFAGRYVFTGFRTDTPLSFLGADDINYTITEQLKNSIIDSVVKVDTGKVLDINSANFSSDSMKDIDEESVSVAEVHRIRLAYNDLNAGTIPTLSYTQAKKIPVQEVDGNGNPVWETDKDGNKVLDGNGDPIPVQATQQKQQEKKDEAGNTVYETNADGSFKLDTDGNKIPVMEPVTDENGDPVMEPVWEMNEDGSYKYETDAKGNVVYETVEWNDAKIMHSYEDPYNYVAANPDALVLVPETGELLLGEERYAELMTLKDDAATVKDESEIRVTYEKNSWMKGDLRPEHYFACTSYPKEGDPIVYNAAYLEEGLRERQEIEYDVGFNQTIRVNSTADQCFKHGIGREVDDILNAMQDVLELEGVVNNIKSMLDKTEGSSDEGKILKKQLDAANKALTLAKDKEQRLFEGGITAFQGYLDDADLCITDCGTRSSKLSLIENRMQNQKTTFETLKSENEDIDITEVAIQLSSAEMTYEAALMAAGKVMQTTLLNFI